MRKEIAQQNKLILDFGQKHMLQWKQDVQHNDVFLATYGNEMNHKILNKLEQLIHVSPQLLRQPNTLRHAIQNTFDIELDQIEYSHMGELVDQIDDKVLDNYFRNHWQGEMKKYKYSGLKLIDEVNSLNPRRVLDIGCGYHEFKGKINNLVGIDPYNNATDIHVKLLDYNPDEKYDATLALGSINFGSTDKVFAELEHAVSLCNPNAVMFFRVNPDPYHMTKQIDLWVVKNHKQLDLLLPLGCKLHC